MGTAVAGFGDAMVTGRGRRRPNGAGSVYAKGAGRYVAAVTLPDGRRREWSFRGPQARRLAERKRDAVLRALAEAQPLPDERLTLARFLADWLAAVRPSLALPKNPHLPKKSGGCPNSAITGCQTRGR